MRFSFEWLKRYLNTELNLQQIAECLTSIGLEVEEIEDPYEKFKNFKLVEIKKIEDHPNADRLHLCTVSDAVGEEARIVCGAKNVRVGLKTILATEGAFIPGGQFVLKKSKIRGVVSEGMMCSREELALPPKEDGIIDLDPSTDLSVSVGSVLGYGGGIIDVSLTPNRGDCFSVKGIARDLAAAGAGTFIKNTYVACEISEKFSLNIQQDNSRLLKNYIPSAAFRTMHNVQNGESPDWLKNELHIAGINSISLLVDLGNWLMIDRGRPLHIYDLDKIEGDFHIRFAKQREKFVDLKGDKRDLQSDMLVAADDNDVLCVFGVMGGQKTACTEDTKNILIESALFDAIMVAKTGNFLNITSDSRTRFERKIDTASCVPGIEAISKLIQEHCGGTCSDIKVLGNTPTERPIIKLSKDSLYDIAGGAIPWEKALDILERLGLQKIESSDDSTRFKIPSWRGDLSIEEDLIEEILRIYGYGNITGQPLTPKLSEKDIRWDKFTHEMSIKRLLTRDLSEVITYSFIREEYAKAFAESNKLIYLLNPISSDLNTMRPSLIPNLITTAQRSLNFGKTSVKLFEIGHVFYNDCMQRTHISGLRVGRYSDRHWLNKIRNADVFDIKADAMLVLRHCGIEERSITFENKTPSYYHPYRSAVITRYGCILGYFGELHPQVTKLFGVSDRILCFELMFDECELGRARKTMFEPKVFPKITRDFSIVFKHRIAVGNLLNEIWKLDQLINDVSVFDHFDMEDGRTSIGISVVFKAKDRTLTEDEAQQLSNDIIKLISTKGGELRKK